MNNEELTRVLSYSRQSGPMAEYRILVVSLCVGGLAATYWIVRTSFLFVIPVLIGLVGVGLAFIANGRMSKRRAQIAATIIAALCVAGPLVVIIGIELLKPRYQLLLPEGFEGVVTVTVDSKHGTRASRRGLWQVYRVPESGRVEVKSFDSLCGRYRDVRVSYWGGESLPKDALLPLGIEDKGGQRSYLWRIRRAEQ